MVRLVRLSLMLRIVGMMMCIMVCTEAFRMWLGLVEFDCDVLTS